MNGTANTPAFLTRKWTNEPMKPGNDAASKAKTKPQYRCFAMPMIGYSSFVAHLPRPKASRRRARHSSETKWDESCPKRKRRSLISRMVLNSWGFAFFAVTDPQMVAR